MSMPKPQIVQPEPPAEEVPVAIIATAIVEIAAAMKVLNETRLSRRAIVTLIHEQSTLPRRHIEIVLNNLDSLEETWLKPLRK